MLNLYSDKTDYLVITFGVALNPSLKEQIEGLASHVRDAGLQRFPTLTLTAITFSTAQNLRVGNVVVTPESPQETLGATDTTIPSHHEFFFQQLLLGLIQNNSLMGLSLIQSVQGNKTIPNTLF